MFSRPPGLMPPVISSGSLPQSVAAGACYRSSRSQGAVWCDVVERTLDRYLGQIRGVKLGADCRTAAPALPQLSSSKLSELSF